MCAHVCVCLHKALTKSGIRIWTVFNNFRIGSKAISCEHIMNLPQKAAEWPWASQQELSSVMLVISSLVETIKYGHTTLINILLSLSPTLLHAKKCAIFKVWQSVLILRCHSHLYGKQNVPVCFLLKNITWNQITLYTFRYTICDKYISINVTQVTHSTWSQFNFGPYTCQLVKVTLLTECVIVYIGSQCPVQVSYTLKTPCNLKGKSSAG